MNNRDIKVNLSNHIQKYLLKLSSAYNYNTNPTLENILWSAFHGGSTIWSNRAAEQGREVEYAFSQLSLMHCQPQEYCRQQHLPVPDIDQMRLFIYNKTLKFLYQHFGNFYRHPRLTNASDVRGMSRIRVLFHDYLTKTEAGSIERFKLAHEINMEKIKLGIACSIRPGTNIYLTNEGYAPGDFSHLNLSDMQFNRPPNLGDGGFCKLKIDYSNCARSVFTNISLFHANFEGSNLQEADLSRCPLQERINLNNAMLQGAVLNNNPYSYNTNIPVAPPLPYTQNNQPANTVVTRNAPSQVYHLNYNSSSSPVFFNTTQQQRPAPQLRYDQYVTGSFEADMQKALDASLAASESQFFTPAPSTIVRGNANQNQTQQYDDAPEQFYCPITQTIMEHPVLCTLDGRTYEKQAIVDWLQLKRESPFNRQKMPDSYSIENVLVQNINIESMISDYLAKHNNNNSPRPG